jgi:hypothetical protein
LSPPTAPLHAEPQAEISQVFRLTLGLFLGRNRVPNPYVSMT